MDAERFWTIITEVEEVEGAPLYRGRVDNDLMYTEFHGLAYCDEVAFHRRHIPDVQVE